MDTKQLHAVEQRLATFLGDLVPHMGRAERQHWAGMYIRGLLLDGERKSIEPMAARLPGADAQALGQFVNQSPWPWEPVQAALTGAVVDALGCPCRERTPLRVPCQALLNVVILGYC